MLRASWPEERTERLHDFLAANRTVAFEVVLPGAVHMSFTDLPLVDPEGHPPGDLGPRQAHRLISRATIGFLDHHLRDRPGAFSSVIEDLGRAVEGREF